MSRGNAPTPPDVAAAIRAAGLSGASMTSIANTLHVGRTTVTKILDEAGITRQRHDTLPTPGPFDPRPWMDDALCTQVDPEIFHIPKGGSPKAAKRVCARCPVLFECREWALTQPEALQGIWGGLSERERRPLRHQAAA